MNSMGDYDLGSKKTSKLPPLGHVGNDDKYKLPPLGGHKNYEHSLSPKKTKIKELNKVYKVNIGNLEDLPEKYSVLSKAAKKDKQSSIARNYGANNIIEYAANGVKFRKDYNNDY